MNRLRRTVGIAFVVTLTAVLPSGCGDPCKNAESELRKAAAAESKRDRATDPEDVYNFNEVAKEFMSRARQYQRECSAQGG